jgi:hypothetical protein
VGASVAAAPPPERYIKLENLDAGLRRDTRVTRNLLLFCFWLCESPTVDVLAIEAPVTADLESREALLLEQTVDRRGMDPEIIRQLSHRQNWTGDRRLTASRGGILSAALRHNIIDPLAYAAELYPYWFGSKFSH